MFYYAEINSEYLVTNVHSLETASTNESYVSITEDQYTNGDLVGQYYNSLLDIFEVINMMDYMGNSNWMTHKDTKMLLSTKTDNMEAEIDKKADINHMHSNYASTTHTHTASEVGALSANTTIPSALSDLTADSTHRTVTDAEKTAWNAKSNFSGSYNDLTNKPAIPSAYTHPSYTAKTSGLYKVTVDATGHVSAATAVTKADITALGIPASDTNTTYSAATTSAAGLMSASDKSKLDGITTGANAYTLPAAGSALGGVKSGGDVTISSGTITVNDDSHNHVISNIDNLQSTLDGKASSSHNHNSAYISKDLQFTNDTGGVKLSYLKDDGKNVLDEIVSLSIGVYTIYCQSGVTGNPKTTEAWRYLVHKTGSAVCWVQAYGSIGSVYTNYYDGSSGWRGWKCIWDNSPAPLWTGAMYMTSTNSTPQTVTPSKKLSECRNGWLLLWSDYDPGEGANDADFVTTMIPKRNATGGTWGGKSFLCDIPRYVGSDSTDTSTEKRIIKVLYVHDDCIKGSYQNASGDRNDVVLRAVYEF